MKCESIRCMMHALATYTQSFNVPSAANAQLARIAFPTFGVVFGPQMRVVWASDERLLLLSQIVIGINESLQSR